MPCLCRCCLQMAQEQRRAEDALESARKECARLAEDKAGLAAARDEAEKDASRLAMELVSVSVQGRRHGAGHWRSQLLVHARSWCA